MRQSTTVLQRLVIVTLIGALAYLAFGVVAALATDGYDCNTYRNHSGSVPDRYDAAFFYEDGYGWFGPIVVPDGGLQYPPPQGRNSWDIVKKCVGPPPTTTTTSTSTTVTTTTTVPPTTSTVPNTTSTTLSTTTTVPTTVTSSSTSTTTTTAPPTTTTVIDTTTTTVPPTSTSSTVPPTTTPTTTVPELPMTGPADLTPFAVAATILMGLGALLLLAADRQRR